jgi:4-hydroxy-4-methyl-2-oxoglutarate aldolase
VFSAGLSIQGTVKETLGSVNHPIVFGGLWVRPGDILVGDEDGLVLVAREEAAHVAQLSREREGKEAAMMDALRSGADILELSGIGQRLKEKGCTFENASASKA